ncbi:hypothetical protein HY625_03260 [Candidatus Uhrbacteria bacterium]|nr:hypothetical protein [Candidatus Uhrbacteria bacterium]
MSSIPSAHLSHFLEEHFHGVASCPLCKKKYDPLEARIVVAEDGSELVHVECQRCRGAILAAVTNADVGMSVVGVVTDLSPDDLFRLRAREPVTSDDVLALHAAFSADHGRSLLLGVDTKNPA